MIKLLKVSVIVVVGALSLFAASYFTERYAAETAAKEKTLAEAMVRAQIEAEIKKAEEEARLELERQNAALVTTVLETKPPVIETTVTTAAETAAETTTVPTETTTAETFVETVTGTASEEEIITQFTRGGILPADRSGIPLRTMMGLSSSEQEQVIGFLVGHYFLDGFAYAEAETRPKLRERKLLAAEMEDCVVKSLNLVMSSVDISDVSTALTADYGELRKEVEQLRGDFADKYKNASEQGEDFAALYEDSLRYFDRLIKALENIEKTAKRYSETTNPLLAIGILTSSLNDVIIPEIMGVLEQSFDLVEVSQEIFLEGTQGTRLLSRDEVRDIITNPALVLDTNIK